MRLPFSLNRTLSVSRIPQRSPQTWCATKNVRSPIRTSQSPVFFFKPQKFVPFRIPPRLPMRLPLRITCRNAVRRKNRNGKRRPNTLRRPRFVAKLYNPHSYSFIFFILKFEKKSTRVPKIGKMHTRQRHGFRNVFRGVTWQILKVIAEIFDAQSVVPCQIRFVDSFAAKRKKSVFRCLNKFDTRAVKRLRKTRKFFLGRVIRFTCPCSEAQMRFVVRDFIKPLAPQ